MLIKYWYFALHRLLAYQRILSVYNFWFIRLGSAFVFPDSEAPIINNPYRWSRMWGLFEWCPFMFYFVSSIRFGSQCNKICHCFPISSFIDPNTFYFFIFVMFFLIWSVNSCLKIFSTSCFNIIPLFLHILVSRNHAKSLALIFYLFRVLIDLNRPFIHEYLFFPFLPIINFLKKCLLYDS